MPKKSVRLLLFRLLLSGAVFSRFLKLVIEGKTQDIAQYLLVPGGGLVGELVGVTLPEEGAVDEGGVVHVEGIDNLLLGPGYLSICKASRFGV